MAFGQAIAQARGVLVNDPFETSEVRRALERRPIDAAVVAEVGRLFIAISAILDLHADLAGHDLPQPTQDAIGAHHQALAGWFRQAASWARSGEGAGEVVDGLPKPPVLSGPGDHFTVGAIWYGVIVDVAIDIHDGAIRSRQQLGRGEMSFSRARDHGQRRLIRVGPSQAKQLRRQYRQDAQARQESTRCVSPPRNGASEIQG